jgi:hypothetical protein
MLENINLKKSLSREDYKLALPVLQQRLYDLRNSPQPRCIIRLL